jgi:hypothetical protein
MSTSAINLSIVSVTLNDYIGLDATFQSLQNQVVKNFRWIIKESSISSYGRKYEYLSWVEYINSDDRSIYDAMNQSLVYVTGSHYIFLNSGDIFYDSHATDHINKAILLVDSPRTVLCFSTMVDFGSNLLVLSKALSSSCMYRKSPSYHQSTVYPVLPDLNLRYDLKYSICGDFYFNLLHAYHGVKFVPFPEIILSVFMKGGLSTQRPIQSFFEFFLILRKSNTVSLPILCFASIARLFSSLSHYCLFYILKITPKR